MEGCPTIRAIEDTPGLIHVYHDTYPFPAYSEYVYLENGWIGMIHTGKNDPNVQIHTDSARRELRALQRVQSASTQESMHDPLPEAIAV